MTRTERATSPRAILKDRAESKSGYDKSLRKSGAGGHNWGSLRDELDLEREALEDNGIDTEELTNVTDANADIRPSVDAPPEGEPIDKTNAVTSEADVEKAHEFRAGGLNDNVTLGDIARTSAGAFADHPTSTVEISRDAPTNTLSNA